MPVQIDEVQAELVNAPKSESGNPRQKAGAEPDMTRIFEKLAQRAKRLRAD